MKRILPILILAALAFSGCGHKPVEYKESNEGENLIENSRAFVEKTIKDAKHYNAEDWQKSLEQFQHMCKDFRANGWHYFEKDRMVLDHLRLDYLEAVATNGDEELVSQAKQIYIDVMTN